MAEVSDAAGFHRSRSADYIVVSLWPSRGLYVSGIELKSFRGDWLNELKNPKKAENIFKYCDYFWLLTVDDTIAKIEEIPATWGWMCIKGGKVTVKKEAPKLLPEGISNHFMAAMLKRAQDKTNFVHKDSIQDKINEANERGKVEGNRILEQTLKDLREIRTAVSDFERESGIDLKNYMRWSTNPIKMGQAVKFLENGGAETIKKQLLELERTAKIVHDKITDGLKTLQ